MSENQQPQTRQVIQIDRPGEMAAIIVRGYDIGVIVGEESAVLLVCSPPSYLNHDGEPIHYLTITLGPR